MSGGADSLALLALAVQWGCKATAYHVDHGLRPGSAEEADVVAEAAKQLGAGFKSLKVDVAPGPNLEARARYARLSALPSGVATGHTADDQAETVLLNMMRGAGLDGLAGMRQGPSHPILRLRRYETRALCAAAGLGAIEDPSNAELCFSRNRVRHELLPLMCEIARRDVGDILARQAGLLAGEADLLEDLAAQALAGCDLQEVQTATFTSLPLPLARRAVRRWLRAGDAYPPSLKDVDSVLAVASRRSKATEVAGGWRVWRSKGRLRRTPPLRSTTMVGDARR
ncbi:MAG: tRNA lysidine(34) synthetase TilS [Actinobacteria bacterium]|nr:tRNA lysidine(34) synthetase TilS [Actinomycetota bacterium]